MDGAKDIIVDIKNALTSKSPLLDGVGPDTREELLKRIISFHGYAAPGVIIGGIVASIAMEQIPDGVLLGPQHML